MKEKILSVLKTKYSNLGFSQKAFDGVASYLEKTVSDESQIETAASGVEPLLKVFQAESDRARTEYNALKGELETLKGKATSSSANGGGQDKKIEPEKPTFDPEAFKADLLKTFREEQTLAIQQAQQIAQRNAVIVSKAKEFGIPEKFVTKLSIAQDADLDEYFKSVKQDLIDAGFEFAEPPTRGSGISDNGNDIAKLINTGTEQFVKSQTK